jgi:hypothetical protein
MKSKKRAPIGFEPGSCGLTFRVCCQWARKVYSFDVKIHFIEHHKVPPCSADLYTVLGTHVESEALSTYCTRYSCCQMD